MKSFLVAFISCLIFFLFAEIVARLWVAKYGDALDITKRILRADQTIGWEARPNLNTRFLNLPLKTNEWGWRTTSVPSFNISEPKILVLGPSSTFGWGVKASDTYSSQLEALLAAKKFVMVINAGEIGYSTDQGLRLVNRPQVQAIKPKIVVIAYGVNDIDRHRFYFQSDKTDAEEFAQFKGSKGVTLINMISKSSLLDLLFKAAGNARSFLNLDKQVSVQNPVPTLRVPPEDFRQNLEGLINKAKSQGAAVIVLTTRTNLPSLETKAENYESLYYFAAEAQKQGNQKQVREYLKMARASEPYRIRRDVEVYNSIVRKTTYAQGVLLGDLDVWMNKLDQNPLFVDPIHFSKAGNAIVARGLSDIIFGNKLLD